MADRIYDNLYEGLDYIGFENKYTSIHNKKIRTVTIVLVVLWLCMFSTMIIYSIVLKQSNRGNNNNSNYNKERALNAAIAGVLFTSVPFLIYLYIFIQQRRGKSDIKWKLYDTIIFVFLSIIFGFTVIMIIGILIDQTASLGWTSGFSLVIVIFSALLWSILTIFLIASPFFNLETRKYILEVSKPTRYTNKVSIE